MFGDEAYTVVSSANITHFVLIRQESRSLVYIINKRGPSTLPCGTPQDIFSVVETFVFVLYVVFYVS